MRLIPDVLAHAMPDGLAVRDAVVGLEIVGKYLGVALYMVGGEPLEGVLAGAGNHLGPDELGVVVTGTRHDGLSYGAAPGVELTVGVLVLFPSAKVTPRPTRPALGGTGRGDLRSSCGCGGRGAKRFFG